MPETPDDPPAPPSQARSSDSEPSKPSSGDAAAGYPGGESQLDVTAAMGAPTEPALDLTPGGPLPIKRATLMHSDVGAGSDDDTPSSQKLRNIESYVGFIVDGRYLIESVIAQGGMGVVYFARHRLIDKPVALKVLRPELVHNRDITARFLTEAQAASSIGSEHIVDVTDYGELPDGATYIVMEYLDGYSLNQRMHRAGGLLPVPTVLAVARQIAEGLQRAHEANIVHRDLKPDNILLVRKGKQDDFVKILDFGIAKVLSGQNQTTSAGRIFGTPHYMSPEQGRGGEVDHRTDIYSLGVILYEMIAGHVPFDGENPLGILTQHLYVEAKALTGQCEPERVTPALECVVARCLMKDPAHRYSSMSDVDEDLRRLEQVEPPVAWEYFKQATVVPEYLRTLIDAPRPRARRRWSSPLLLIATGAGLVALWQSTQASLSTPEGGLASSQSSVEAPTSAGEVTTTVNLAAEPIDAHVFRGNKDLGQIPILVQLKPGQRVALTFRRDGYLPYHLVIDGSKPSYAIRMKHRTDKVTAVPPMPTVSPSGPTRVVDLREATDPVETPLDLQSEDAGRVPALDAVFDDPNAIATASRNPGAIAPISLPPEYMDPTLAPAPPGPPAGERGEANEKDTSPTSNDNPSPFTIERAGAGAASTLAPPGPPPVNN